MFIPGGRGDTKNIGDGSPRITVGSPFFRGFERSLKTVGAANRGASATACAWSEGGCALAGTGVAMICKAVIAINENPTDGSRWTSDPCRDIVIGTSRLT
jgi:hypothetical protein